MQNASSLFLKELIEGEHTTSSGSSFHDFTTRSVKKFFLFSEIHDLG